MSTGSKDSTAHTDISLWIAVASALGYLLFYQSAPVEISLILTITILAWIGLGVAGLLFLLIVAYHEILSGVLDKLFGGGGGVNDFNPKGLFDHIRNYLIAGALLYSGITLFATELSYVTVLGGTLFLLSFVFGIINFMHGKRAISKFLDEEANTSEMSGLRLKIWNMGLPKLPAYLFLPVLALTGALQAHTLYTNTVRAESVLNVICQDQQIPQSAKARYCP